MKPICSYTEAFSERLYTDDTFSSLDDLPIFSRKIWNMAHCGCMYCGQKMEIITFPFDHLGRRNDVANVCTQCGWWRYTISVSGGQDTISRNFTFGEACYYDVNSLEVPIIELRRYLKNNPQAVAQTDPHRFEKLMADCVKDAFGPCEVIHVGGTADGGIDLKLIMNNSETFLVQVKRRQNIEKNESVQVVRELNGVLFREGIAKGMIITTAKGYTQAAQRETAIKTITNDKYEIKLLGFSDIVDMLQLKCQSPYEPWKAHIKLPSEKIV